LRVCHLGACPGGLEQFLECRQRSACHEAGHALLLCLVAATGGNRSRVALPRLIFGLGSVSDGDLALPEETADNPWNDALVLLGGPAADAEVHGQAIPQDGEDCARAKRLLESANMGLGLADALSVTRELVAHHAGVLQTITLELLRRGTLVGSEAWRLFQEARRDSSPLPCSGGFRGPTLAAPADAFPGSMGDFARRAGPRPSSTRIRGNHGERPGALGRR